MTIKLIIICHQHSVTLDDHIRVEGVQGVHMHPPIIDKFQSLMMKLIAICHQMLVFIRKVTFGDI